MANLTGMGLTRRDFLKAGAATGAALLVARPGSVFGATGPAAFGTSRTSRLFPGNGTFVVQADMHNHTLLSGGATSPQQAYDLMRGVGLDVAAITDHSLFGKVVGPVCGDSPCRDYAGINEASWQQLAKDADAKVVDGAFVAMRGFEWTTGTIGHMNVWFSSQWTDTMVTGGQSPKGLEAALANIPEPGPSLAPAVAPAIAQLPETASMDGFYEWLQSSPDRPVLGGGADALVGFNHPNDYGNFENFEFAAALVERVVSYEAMNTDRDHVFYGMDKGLPSPLNACLNAGWRVGMLGVSDEHGDKWGDNRSRGGMWVRSLTRDGVREAMQARRIYSTHERGLRLDAAANGVPMGSRVGHRTGTVRFDLDGDRGPASYGRPLRVQLLRPGKTSPTLAHEQDVRLPSLDEPVITFSVPVDVADGNWAVLRVTDPSQPAEPWTPAEYKGAGRAIAYASPFWFDPDAPTGTAAPATAVAGTQRSRGATLPSTGGSAGVAALGAVAAMGAVAARRALHHTHD